MLCCCAGFTPVGQHDEAHQQEGAVHSGWLHRDSGSVQVESGQPWAGSCCPILAYVEIAAALDHLGRYGHSCRREASGTFKRRVV